MKKISFKTAYLFYLAILALIVMILLLSVYRILAHYEKAQANYKVDDYISVLQDAVDNEKTEVIVSLNTDELSTRFVSKEDLASHFIEVCKGKTLSYEASSKSFDVNRPIYNISCDGNPVATIQLNLISETKKLGFLSIPEWEMYNFSVATNAFSTAYTISLPSDFTIKVNDVLLNENDVVSMENDICAYYFTGFVSEPVLKITDSFGNRVNEGSLSLLSDASPAAQIYSFTPVYERFDFAVPTTFTVTIHNGDFSNTLLGNLAVYSMYTAEPVTSDFLAAHVEATDVLDNPLTFSESEGRLLPVYTEYTINAADCYRVFADETLLDPASATLSEFTTAQYSDTPLALATYNIALAKEATFCVSDEQGTLLDLEISGTTIHAPLYDYTITIPGNFELLINGKVPECTPAYADNSDYQYVTEYAELPQLLTYRFEKLAKTPTFTVTDNLGNPVHHLLTNGGELSITEQATLDELPETLRNQVDPLEIAKTWSLYLTDDLEGTLNGYYNMRSYLIQDSYYDTVAYRWATDVDITYISNHSLRDPAFTEESVKNIVLYGDNCFSCDIYFVKHIVLTKTGKFRDDIFNHRIYFVYIDDTDDNTDNPHWAICDMLEIQ